MAKGTEGRGYFPGNEAVIASLSAGKLTPGTLTVEQLHSSELVIQRAPRVLVVGARSGSLGYHVARVLTDRYRADVVAAGVSTEPLHLDVRDWGRCMEVIQQVDPTHVVCTVGINDGSPFYEDGWETKAQDAMEVNYLGPMRLLAAFESWHDAMPGSFVVVSSNSAHIARSSSAAYCASKAALSMAVRCAARDLTRAEKPINLWGYEPGALAGTPMTRSVAGNLGKDVPMSRMLTYPDGLPVAVVGERIAADLMEQQASLLHGTMIRMDNGEQ